MNNIYKYFGELEEIENQMMLDSLNRMIDEKLIKPYHKSEKLIDLHTHTKYSDGDLSPDELVRLAIEKRVDTLAITDHDTIDGIKQIDKKDPFIKETGIKIINGIELTAKAPKGRMHILGYGIDLKNKELNKKMEELQSNSINSVLSIIEQIKRDYGIIFRYQELKDLVNAHHNIGRPDIAKLCVKNGYAKTIQEAFDLYLIDAHQKTRENNKINSK